MCYTHRLNLISEKVKCQREFRPQISKVKTSIVSQIQAALNNLTPSEVDFSLVPKAQGQPQRGVPNE